VGKTINDVGKRLNETPEDLRPGKVIFVITTDGLENASRKFSYNEVKRMITHQTEKYGWEFIFMGANIDAAEEGEKLGIDIDHTIQFEANSCGVSKTFSRLEGFCDNIRTSRIKPKKAKTV
jgi:hypothetical protein